MYYSSADEEEDRELMPVAFAVRGERKPEDGPPTTGEEYLMHVRWEAKSVPKVVVSNIDPRKYDNNQTTHWTTTTFIAAPKGLEPPTEWANSFLITFKHLRESMEAKASNAQLPVDVKLPPGKDRKQWFTFCFGSSANKRKQDKITNLDQKESTSNTSVSTTTTTTTIGINNEKTEKSEKSENKNNNNFETEKTLQTQAQTPQVQFSPLDVEMKESQTPSNTTNNSTTPNLKPSSEQQQVVPTEPTSVAPIKLANQPLLNIVLSFDSIKVRNLIDFYAGWVDDFSEFSDIQAQWLFALLTRLDWPIDSDVAWNLRTILRKLCEWRAELTSVEDPKLAPINILITIITKFFEQQ